MAVKVIPHSESAAPRVRQEVELCTSLVHPNVVRSLAVEVHTLDAREVAEVGGGVGHKMCGWV